MELRLEERVHRPTLWTTEDLRGFRAPPLPVASLYVQQGCTAKETITVLSFISLCKSFPLDL